jgi:hypothetical protein
MAQNPISIWLTGDRNYQEGVSLFEKFSDKEFTKSILRKGEGPVTRKILDNEMEAIGGTIEVVAPKANAIWRGDDYKDLPDLVKRWIDEMKLLYKTNQHRKSQLEIILDLTQRGDMANTILDDEEIIEQLKYKINYFQKHRQLPPEEKTIDFDPEEFQPHELLQKISLLSSQISKQKNNPLRQDDVSSWTAERDKLKQIYEGIV